VIVAPTSCYSVQSFTVVNWDLWNMKNVSSQYSWDLWYVVNILFVHYKGAHNIFSTICVSSSFLVFIVVVLRLLHVLHSLGSCTTNNIDT
jgi:hypothetical protein